MEREMFMEDKASARHWHCMSFADKMEFVNERNCIKGLYSHQYYVEIMCNPMLKKQESNDN